MPLDMPAFICKDFNNVLDPSERVGKRVPVEKEFIDFVDTCAYLTLQDVPSTGCYFTWNDKFVSSKIDRTIVNSFWMEENLFCRTEFLTRGTTSDHSACIFTLSVMVPTFKREFKFYIAWMDHPSFHKTLEDYWKTTRFQGDEQENLSLKLLHLRPLLRELNKSHFNKLFERAETARRCLVGAQRDCDLDPLNRDLQKIELEARLLSQRLDVWKENF